MADLEVVTTYKGNDADGFRSYYQNEGRPTVSLNAKNFYSSIFGVLKEAQPIAIEDDRNSNQIIFKEYYKIENFSRG